jgi:hypothetical protein
LSVIVNYYTISVVVLNKQIIIFNFKQGTMKIFISFNEKLNEIEIKEDKTINELKQEIEGKYNIKKEFQILRKSNGDFCFENTIIDNKIKEEDILHLLNIEEGEDNKLEKSIAVKEENHLCGNIFFKLLIEACIIFNEEIEALYFCKDCKKKLCESCKDGHLKRGKTIHNENSIISTKENDLKSYYCQDHTNEISKYLCLKCEKFICVECIFSKAHDNHDRVKINESNEKILQINKKIIKLFDTKIDNYKKEVEKFIENENKYHEEIKNIEMKIIENKKDKNEVLFNLQKILNYKNISEEKPIQFLLNYKKILNNNNNYSFIYKNNKKFTVKKVYSFGKNNYYQLGL